jgi:branched-chain amino acid transport system substrate-binding protein
MSATVAACGSESKSADATSSTGSLACKDGSITVGLAKAKSGGATFFEQAGANGVLVAIDRLNDSGGLNGCQLKVIEEDTQSDPAVGAQAARSLIDKGAQILVVPDDFDLGIAAARVGDKAGVLTLSTAAGSLLFGSAVGPSMVDGGITTKALGNAQAKFALDQGYKTVFHVVDPGLAFFTEQDTHFDKTFTAGGGKQVGKDDVDSLGGQSDFSSTISKIRAANPDVVTVQMVFPQAGTFVKQLRSAGVKTPVVNGTTLGTPELPRLVGEAGLEDVFWAEQVYFEGAGSDPEIDPEIAEFAKAYEAKTGEPPNQGNAPNSYQSFLAIAQALDDPSVKDAETAAKAIAKQANVKVPGGTLVGWDNGHAIWNASIVGYKDGDFKLITTVPAD